MLSDPDVPAELAELLAERRRVRELVIRLVAELILESLGRGRVGQDLGGHPRSRATVPIRRVVPSDASVDVRFVLTGIRGQARLLAGMVRAAHHGPTAAHHDGAEEL